MQILAIPKRERIYAIAFSPSGRDLVAACGDGKIRVWDTTTGDIRHIGSLEEESYGSAITFVSDHSIVIAANGLLHWDMAANEWTQAIRVARSTSQLALSPDGRFLAEVDEIHSTDSPGSGLDIHDIVNWKGTLLQEDIHDTSGGVAFSSDGGWLATSHIVRVGQKERTLGVQFGRYLTNEYDYVVRIRESPSYRTVRSIPGWGQGVRFLAFSPDGNTLAGTAGPRLRIWDLLGDRELAVQKRGSRHFQGLAFTIDGRYLATVSNDTTVRMWDARTWNETSTFEWKIGRLLNIAIAPDGMRAAAGSDKGQIVIWDLDE